VARPNPPEKWETAEVPHLRIVEDGLWSQVKGRQKDVRIEIGRAGRQRAQSSPPAALPAQRAALLRLLRGRLHDRRTGPLRLRDTPVQRNLLERGGYWTAGSREPRVGRPQGPADGAGLVAVFIEKFNAELRRIAKESEGELDRARHAIADVERKIGGIVEAIEDGAYNPTLKALLKEVARAYRCFDAVLTGTVTSMIELATREAIDARYVRRLLPLAFLAPEIVEAILKGTHPVDLTAKKLIRRTALPLDRRMQSRPSASARGRPTGSSPNRVLQIAARDNTANPVEFSAHCRSPVPERLAECRQ
jgi:hypothetical protein